MKIFFLSSKFDKNALVSFQFQTLWEDLFTQNTEEHCMLNIAGRFSYTKYWGILYVEHWEDLFTQNTEE